MLQSAVLRIIAWVFAGLALAACAGSPVTTDYDTAVDFTTYRHYAWLEGKADKAGDSRGTNPLVDARIKEAIDRVLQARGYRLAANAQTPDFLVGFHISMRTRLDSSSLNTYYGFGMSSGGRRGGSVGISVGGPVSTRSREYQEGTLLIDIADSTTHKLSWRGSTSRRLSEKSDPERSQALINKVVEEILSRFPPGAPRKASMEETR